MSPCLLNKARPGVAVASCLVCTKTPATFCSAADHDQSHGFSFTWLSSCVWTMVLYIPSTPGREEKERRPPAIPFPGEGVCHQKSWLPLYVDCSLFISSQHLQYGRSSPRKAGRKLVFPGCLVKGDSWGRGYQRLWLNQPTIPTTGSAFFLCFMWELISWNSYLCSLPILSYQLIHQN